MRQYVFAAFAAALAACAPSAPTGAKSEAASSTCPDDGARLAVTGICVGRASNYYDADVLARSQALEGPAAGCSWTFNETAIADGSEAILYRAMTCNGVTTKLAYAGGAHSASLSYEASALAGAAVAGQERVRIFVSDPADPQKVIRDLIEAAPAAERAKCEVQPANIEGWPRDALVIGYKAADAARLPKNEPNAVCGEFGLDEDQMKYWLVRQGFAYFFALGQDGLDFDPNTFLLFRRGADGTWAPAE
ncbi:MAG: hypothetical protein JNJ73_20840 [Hyphomonadaceae bacterium]|nr:hypothetical protein [Hyphomonadaceae bacterium]